MAASGLIYGFHAVTSRLRAHPDSVLEVIVDAARDDARAAGLRRLAEAHGVRVRAVSRERLDGLMHGTRHQGVVARVTGIAQAHSIDELLDALRVPPLLLVLDGVTDPHNLGACLRVADAAGAHAVIAPKDRAAGLGGTAAKVASGAAETVPYLTVTNLSRALDDLKARDVWVIGADAEATEDLFTRMPRRPRTSSPPSCRRRSRGCSAQKGTACVASRANGAIGGCESRCTGQSRA